MPQIGQYSLAIESFRGAHLSPEGYGESVAGTGVVGNGASKPLSGLYTSSGLLASAFPLVSGLTLTDELDYACLAQLIAQLGATPPAGVHPQIGGKVELHHKGLYVVNNALTLGSGINLVGGGRQTVIKRSGTLATGAGFLDIPAGSVGVTVSDLLIEGNVTTPTGINYSAIGGDPFYAPLVANSSAWIHGGSSAATEDITFYNCVFTHTGGYAVIIDARTGNVRNVRFVSCTFINNRPHLFGTSGGDLNYGSWTGGVLYANNGDSAVNSFCASKILFENCRHIRCTGNQIWGHSTALTVHNEDIRIIGGTFQDLGLDATEMGNVQGGAVSDCTFRRIGYVTQTDTDAPSPSNLSGRNAVAMDSSGFVSGVDYSDNVATSVNGEFVDLDGFRDGSVNNNVFRIPDSSDPLYAADSIALYGPSQNGINETRGIQTGNTNLNGGGWNIEIFGNSIIGCGLSSIVLAYGKKCSIRNNTIVQPATSLEVPIQLFSASGSGDETLCHDNEVTGNKIDYSGANFAVAETGTGWTSAAVNQVAFNSLTGSCLGEVFFATGSGSRSGLTLSTNAPAPAAGSANTVQREGYGTTAALKHYTVLAGTATQVSQLNDVGPLLNISANGAANTGAITTGAVSALGFFDAMATKRLLSVGGFLGFLDTGTFDTAGDSLDAASASPATWALIRYNKAAGALQVSVATDSSAHRIWSSVGGAGSGTSAPAGANSQIQYNSAGSLGASANFKYDATAQSLKVLGVAATAAIVAGGGFIQSAGGFVTTSTAYNSVQTTGGMYAVLGFTLDQALYSKLTAASSSLNTPGSGYGGIAYKGGTQWWYYNASTSAWASVDFSTIGSGVTSLAGTAAQVTVSGSTGAVTLSLPSTVNTALFNSTATGPAIAFQAGSGNLQINGSGALSAAGVITSAIGLASTGTSATSIQTAGGLVAMGNFGLGTASPAFTLHVLKTSDIAFVLDRSGGSQGLLESTSTSTAVGTLNSTPLYFAINNAIVAGFDTAGRYTVFGGIGLAAITATSGYMSSAEGYHTSSTASNAIQAPSGGVNAQFLIATDRLYVIGQSGIPSGPASGQFALYADLSGVGHYWTGSGWAAFGAATGVTSLAGTANQINVSASTGAVTLSLPTTVNTSLFNSTAVGSAIAFQAGSGTFQVNAAGAVSAAGIITSAANIVALGNLGIGGSPAYTVHVAKTSDIALVLDRSGGSQGLFESTSTSTAIGTLNATPCYFAVNNGLVGGFDTAGRFSVLGGTGLAAITATSGYMSSAEGYHTSSTASNAIQAPSGGVNAQFLIATDRIYLIGQGGVPSGPGSGQFAMYADASGVAHYWAGSAWAALNQSLATTADVAFRTVTASGVSGAAAITATAGYMTAADGFHTASTAANAIQAPSGGVTSRYLVATDRAYLIGQGTAPSGPSSGQFAMYADASGFGYWWNPATSAWVQFAPPTGTGSGSGVTSLAAGTGITVSAATGAVTAALDSTASVAFQALTISGTSGTAAVAATAGYMTAADGFHTTSSASNAIQAPNGGVTSRYLVATDRAYLIGQGSAPSGPSSGQFAMYADASGNGYWWNPGTSAWVQFAASSGGSGVTSLSNGTGISLSGSTGAVVITNAGVVSVQGITNVVTFTAGLGIAISGLTFALDSTAAVTFRSITASGTAGTAAITISAGYMSCAEGYHTSSTATNAIQAPSGGVTGQFLIASDRLYLLGQGAAPAGPSSGQFAMYADLSGMGHYWTGSGWAALGSGGSAGVSSLTNGTGISLSGSTGAVTVTNAGVVSVQGTTNVVTFTAGTGVSISGLTFSIGQSVATTANVIFGTMHAGGAVQSGSTGSAIAFQTANSNFSVDGSGNISGAGSLNMLAGLRSNSINVVNTLGHFIGPGMDVGSNGVSAGGYNIYGGFAGQTWDIYGSFTILGTTYSRLIVKGGVIVSAA